MNSKTSRSLLIQAHRPGRALEADRVQIRQQRMDCGSVRPGRAAHRVTHPHHRSAHVPAAERHLRMLRWLHITLCHNRERADSRARARCVPDRPVNPGYWQSLTGHSNLAADLRIGKSEDNRPRPPKQ